MRVEDLYDAAASAGLTTAVKVGAVTEQTALRAPDATVLDGLALSRDSTIEYPTSRLSLSPGSMVEIDGVSYRVRAVRQLRDGSESAADLSRIGP